MPAIDRISSHTPAFQSLELGELPKAKIPEPKGVGELFRDGQIARTPSELARDKAICVDGKEPLLPIDPPFAVLNDSTTIGLKPYGDTFRYEQMMSKLSEAIAAFAKLTPSERAEVQENIAEIQRATADKLESAPKQNFDALQAEYYKAMFAMLNEYDETLSTSVMGLREEISRMSAQRDEEFQRIQDRLDRNRWYEWVGMGATALTGAAAALAIGTGWGAVAVGVATLIALLVSTDSLMGDPVKHSIATLGAEKDHQLIRDRMETLNAASGLVSLGCSLVNIFVGAGAVAKGAGDVLRASASILSGLSQISVAANNAVNTVDQATVEGLNHEIERDDERMNDELTLLEDSHSRFQEYARQRRQILKAEHEAAMHIYR